MTMEISHSFQCVVRFATPEGQHKACQLKHGDFCVFVSQKKSPVYKIDETDVKSPAVPFDRENMSRVRHASASTRNAPQMGLVEPRRQMEMLAVSPAASRTPGCEPQMGVVEPLENRTSSPDRRSHRARENGGPSEGTLRIYRQQRQLPRTNSGRRIRTQTDATDYRTQNASRSSRNMRDTSQPLILAIDDTPTPHSASSDFPDDRTAVVSGRNSELALLRTNSEQSVESSIHTSASGSSRSRSPRGSISSMRFFVRNRSNQGRGTLVVEKEMSVYTLKVKIGQVYNIGEPFQLWNRRLEKFVGDDLEDERRVKLGDTDLAWDDELIIVMKDELIQEEEPPPVAGGAGGGRSRFKRMQQRRQHISRAHRAKTSPDIVVPRSREPPVFEIQEYSYDESPQYPDAVHRNPVPPNASNFASDIQEKRALRRQALNSRAPPNRRPPSASVSLPLFVESGDNRRAEGVTNRNRPVSTRSRVNVPAITVPHRPVRSRSNHVPSHNVRQPPPRVHSYHARNPSSTRVRMNQKMVIRKPVREGEDGGPLSIRQLNWSNNLDFFPNSRGHQVDYEPLLAAHETVLSAQQLVSTSAVNREFVSAMNFVSEDEPVPPEAHAHAHRRPARRVKVTQQRRIPIRIDGSSQLHHSNSHPRLNTTHEHRRGIYTTEHQQNQALFFFSDEGTGPPLPSAPSAPEPPREPSRQPDRNAALLQPPMSAIGSFEVSEGGNNNHWVPASPLQTHSASPRDDAQLAQELALEMDAEQQRQSTQLALQMIQYWDEASDDEKFMRPESPEEMMLIQPRRGFVVNDWEQGNHLTTIFERFGAFSPANNQFESATYEELLSLDERIPKSGLNEQEIWRLPLRTLENIDQKNRAGKCSVCQEEYEVSDVLRRLPCMHEYHRNCIDQWLERSKKCPVDMNEVRI